MNFVPRISLGWAPGSRVIGSEEVRGSEEIEYARKYEIQK